MEFRDFGSICPRIGKTMRETASLKAIFKYVVCTEESYKRKHHGRTYKVDKHTLQTIETRSGPVKRVVVWEGDADVWELSEKETSKLTNKSHWHEGNHVLEGEQDQLYSSHESHIMHTSCKMWTGRICAD